MEDFVPDLIEQTPIIKGSKCKIFLLLLYVFITYGPLFAGLVIWYLYNFFVAIAFFLFFTLCMGIVISKLRIFSLPETQREMTYSNLQVAKWFLDKNICWRL